MFIQEDLRGYLASRADSMRHEVSRIDESRLLGLPESELLDYLVEKYSVLIPELLESDALADFKETSVEVSNRFEYSMGDGRPVHVAGTRFTLRIPISGETEVLMYRAATRTSVVPFGILDTDSVTFVSTLTQQEVDRAKSTLDSQVDLFKRHLDWTRQDLEQFNSSLRAIASSDIAARKERLLRAKGIAASLGYPLTPRAGSPAATPSPLQRKRITPELPRVTAAPFVPEPALSDEQYSQILSVLTNMVLVMEHSPGAFADMGEEDLRTHFIVQLNGTFEGRASAESFRKSGKTDILLIDSDRSVFVAECKFWKGASSFNSALVQLLSYTTWRDAKTALLIFNRNTDFSAVVEQVPGLLKDHPAVVGPIQRLGETTFRCSAKHPDDPQRRCVVTVLVFNVPTGEQESES